LLLQKNLYSTLKEKGKAETVFRREKKLFRWELLGVKGKGVGNSRRDMKEFGPDRIIKTKNNLRRGKENEKKSDDAGTKGSIENS